MIYNKPSLATEVYRAKVLMTFNTGYNIGHCAGACVVCCVPARGAA